MYFLNVTSGEQEILRKKVSLFSKLFLLNSSSFYRTVNRLIIISTSLENNFIDFII